MSELPLGQPLRPGMHGPDVRRPVSSPEEVRLPGLPGAPSVLPALGTAHTLLGVCSRASPRPPDLSPMKAGILCVLFVAQAQPIHRMDRWKASGCRAFVAEILCQEHGLAPPEAGARGQATGDLWMIALTTRGSRGGGHRTTPGRVSVVALSGEKFPLFLLCLTHT